MRAKKVLAVLLSILYHIGRHEVETMTCQKTSTNKRNFPFLQTDIEKWAFEEQMKSNMGEYINQVQHSVMDYFNKKSLTRAKITDMDRPVIFQKTKDRRWQGTLSLKNGWAAGLSEFTLFGEEIFEYTNLQMTYKSKLKLWDTIQINHDYSILKNRKGFKGKIVSKVKDFHFSLEAFVDFRKKTFKMENFRLECVREINITMTGLRKEMNWVIVGIEGELHGIYEGLVFEDLRGTMLTAIEEAIEDVKFAHHLPELNYEENLAQVTETKQATGKEYEKSDAMTKEILEASSSIKYFRIIPYDGVGDLATLKFIQNEAEMWSFRGQIKEKMNYYLDNLIVYVNKYLTERELERARIPDYSCEFEVTDPENKTIRAKLTLNNGSVFGVNNMLVFGGIKQVEFSEDETTFTNYVHLLNQIKFDQNFKLNVNKTEHTGSIKGKVESITYLHKFAVNLEKSKSIAKMVQLIEMSEVALEVIGLSRETEWMSKRVKGAAQEVFKGPIWHDMDLIIRKAFNQSIAMNYVWIYLPKWSYKRNYRLGTRCANDGTVTICGKNVLETTSAKEQEGNFTAVVHAPVPFIPTEPHRWYFEILLKHSINTYVNKIMEDAGNLIVEQNLSKAKMSECVKNISFESDGKAPWDGNLNFTGVWANGLFPIEKGAVDQISYDSAEIVVTTKNMLWKTVQFNGDFILSTSQAKTKGTISGSINSMIYNIKIRIDYLNAKSVVLEEFNMHCLGEITVHPKANEDLDDSTIDRISEIGAGVFKSEYLKDINMILRRSIEDSIPKNNISWFLPKWNYRKNYKDSNTTIRNKLPNNLKKCPYGYKEGLIINQHGVKFTRLCDMLTGEKLVEFKDYLPTIQIKALMGSFVEQMEQKIDHYVGIFITIVNLRQDNDLYKKPRLMDYDQTFEYKGEDDGGASHELSFSLFEGTMHNLTPVYDLNLRDMKYGERGSLFLLHSQTWYGFQIMYKLTIRFDDIVLRGKISGDVDIPLALLRSRFEIPAKKFVIEDYSIHCVNNFNLDLRVRETEAYWPETEVLNRIEKIFEEKVMGDALSILRLRYEETIDSQMKYMKYFLPDWIYYDSIRDLAIQEMDYSLEPFSDPRTEICKTYRKDRSHSPFSDRLPFIRSESEWWSFEEQLTQGLRVYNTRIKDHAYNFLQNNFLDNSTLPEFTVPFPCTDDNVLGMKGNLTLEGGWAENLSSFDYSTENSLNYRGKQILISIPVKLKEIFKLHYNFNASLSNYSVNGYVEAHAPLLTYMAKILIDPITKQSRLVDFYVDCIGNIDAEVYDFPEEMESTLHHGILKASTSVFSLLMHRDIQQLMHMAVEYAVIYYADMKEFLPEQKYNKNVTWTDYDSKERLQKKIQTCVANPTDTERKF